MENQQLANNVKLLCLENKITLSKLFEELEIPKSFISDITTKNNSPSIKRVKLIADRFHVSIDYLIGRSEKREPTYNIENHSSIYGDIEHNENNIEDLKPLEIEMLSHFRKLSTKEQLKTIENIITEET